jgi:hypothetical protein
MGVYDGQLRSDILRSKAARVAIDATITHKWDLYT